MKRKIILRLSYLIVFLTVFWSCHNEDFASGNIEPQRNNANFFLHSTKGGAAAKSGIDYVAILEAYNRDKNFLSSMPDQQGMPIWDKMKVVNADHTTGLIIPLSHDNETMSSVLFATLDAENNVTGIKDYDNKLLENIVYNENIDHDLRERLFYTFIYMDNQTFGNEHFTGIPKDLFVGKRLNENPQWMRIGDFKSSGDIKTQTDASGKILILETNCGMIHQCTHHGGGGACDNCSSCYFYSCDYIMIYIPDEPFPGGGGGGCTDCGGGGGTPGPQPPVDPCVMNTVFYRIKPGCLGSGGNTDIDDPFDPCKKAKPAIDKANEILHSTAGQAMDSTLKGKIQAPNEWAVAVGQATNGYEVTPAVEGIPGQNSVYTPVSQLTNPLIADGHSHKGARGNPSGGDLYAMIKSTLNHSEFKYRYVYGNNNGVPEVYVLVIHDMALAQDFLADYPEAQNCNNINNDHSLKRDSPIGREFYRAIKHYSEGRAENTSGENYEERAVGMAYILEKFNTGMSIAHVDANENLKKINANIQQITIPYSGGAKKEGIVVSKCP